MNDEFDTDQAVHTPTWAVFGDLMSVMLGAFVLILVGIVAMQIELSTQLEEEVHRRQEQTQHLQEQSQRLRAETERRQTLEQALAAPLAAGRVTLVNGRIGISGSVLFALNSDRLQPEGREILQSLVQPLSDYLLTHSDILMVSGFTDNQPIHDNNRHFADNWELSAQRALTVTRALIEAGVPAASVFAAAFGAEQPVASNNDEAGRAQNRRVEIAPIPKPGDNKEANGE